MKEKLAIIVLAAGLGKRMKQDAPKVSISTREKPMILHVLDSVKEMSPDLLIVVTGHKKEIVENIVNKEYLNVKFAFQEKQLGTADAVKAALPYLDNFTGNVLILCGDTPLITNKSLNDLITSHEENKATLSLISFDADLPNSYGRIIRDKNNIVVKITEAKDCSPEELNIREANAAIYIVESAFLVPAVNEVENKNAQNEYYLTDILEKASKEGQVIHANKLTDPNEALGVNTFKDLHNINRKLIMNKINELIDNEVWFELPETCIIGQDVKIERGVKIGPNTQIVGKTEIKSGVVIEGNALINDSFIEENAIIKFSVRVDSAKIGKNVSVGPFAHIRPETVLEEQSRIGNFVEIKKSIIGKGSKANHLTYIGDSKVGIDSNIGAGTITCNYDGYKKSSTIIGDNVFIGSNSALIAPVEVESGATVGAGSVITKKVEADSLAFTRSPQVAKANWSKIKRQQNKK